MSKTIRINTLTSGGTPSQRNVPNNSAVAAVSKSSPRRLYCNGGPSGGSTSVPSLAERGLK